MSKNIPYKKCLIVVNTYKKESTALGSEVQSFLNERGIQCDVFLFDGISPVGFETLDPLGEMGKNPFASVDFVVTLGGDGTVLFASRCCAFFDIPVFPVNLGLFGFIASVQKNEWKRELVNFLEGKSVIAKRSMVEASLVSKGKTVYSGIGLNDVVLSAKSAMGTISMEVSYNESRFGKIKADGIIVATATGSSAYSASAGGPIIDPGLDALVLTISNPFSLSSRPVVLGAGGEVLVTVLPSRAKEITLTIDGQTPVDVKNGDVLKIKKSEKEALLVGCTREKFYSALRSKMNWMGGPHA